VAKVNCSFRRREVNMIGRGVVRGEGRDGKGRSGKMSRE